MKVQYFIIHFGYFIINRDNRFHIKIQIDRFLFIEKNKKRVSRGGREKEQNFGIQIDRYLFIEKNEERMSRGGREKEQNFDGFLLSENRSIITSNRSLSKENSLPLFVGLGYRA